MTVGQSEVSSFEVLVYLRREVVVPNPWLSVGVEQRRAREVEAIWLLDLSETDKH